MQKNTNTEEFDLLVKEALQNAEAVPSPRVWQAIESRLDAVAAPRQGFRWGWVALAAAAAIAAALVIPSSLKHNSNLLYNPAQERLALAAPNQTINRQEIPSPRVANDVRARDFRDAASPSGDAPLSVAPESAAPEEKAAPAENLAPAGGTTPAGSTDNAAQGSAAPAPQTSSQATAAGTGSQDSFALLAFEENQLARARKSVSVFAGGSLGGNESGPKGAAMAAKNNGAPASDITQTGESNFGIPVSLSLGIRYPITDKLSAGTGVSFSYLTRSFRGRYAEGGILPGPEQDIRHEMQYIGIPVSLFFNVYEGRRFSFYLLGMGEAEWGLGNSYTLSSDNKVIKEDVAGTQFSAGLGFGVEFKLNRSLGLYIDPAVRYYFDCAQPTSIRTEKPFMANIDAGLRFKF